MCFYASKSSSSRNSSPGIGHCSAPKLTRSVCKPSESTWRLGTGKLHEIAERPACGLQSLKDGFMTEALVRTSIKRYFADTAFSSWDTTVPCLLALL